MSFKPAGIGWGIVVAAAVAAQFAVTAAEQKPAAAVDKAAESTAIGQKVADFILSDTSGKQVALTDFRDQKGVVLFFMGTTCPISNLYLPALVELQQKYAARGVQIVGIQSNAGLTAEEVKTHAAEHKFTLPVLHDVEQRVAQQLGATRTSEVFLLDSQRTVRYHGRVDDRYGYTYKRGSARRADLEEALAELLDGKPISVAETAVRGCLLTPQSNSTAKTDVTYAREVSRILQKRCQECHRPDQPGPFALLTYDDAVEHSAMIKEVVLERRMPPWHADPRYGHFSNNRRMGQEEIDQVVAWIDAGTPRGDDKDLPEPVQYAEGWQIGQPDLVFELPQDVTVPAQGTVPYLHFKVPTNFKEDVWIQAAEARPGNRAVVHHIIVYYRDPKKREKEQDRLQDHFVVGTAPGDPPFTLPDGVARRIPAGADLVFQMHYTPNGKEQKDRSQVGLVLYKGTMPPKYNSTAKAIINHRFRIPAGEPNHRVESKHTFDRDMVVFSLMPHMHVRGKDFLFRAVYPDGRSETLLSVPSYDFNWQNTYIPASPLQFPKGTTIECVAHYDNSADNPANPDPKKEVRWGDQTWEEMMIGWLSCAPAESVADPAKPASQGADAGR